MAATDLEISALLPSTRPDVVGRDTTPTESRRFLQNMQAYGQKIALGSGMLLVILVYVWIRYHLRGSLMSLGETWGCDSDPKAHLLWHALLMTIVFTFMTGSCLSVRMLPSSWSARSTHLMHAFVWTLTAVIIYFAIVQARHDPGLACAPIPVPQAPARVPTRVPAQVPPLASVPAPAPVETQTPPASLHHHHNLHKIAGYTVFILMAIQYLLGGRVLSLAGPRRGDRHNQHKLVYAHGILGAGVYATTAAVLCLSLWSTSAGNPWSVDTLLRQSCSVLVVVTTLFTLYGLVDF